MSEVEFFEPMRLPDTTHNALEPGRRKDGSPCIRKSERLRRAEAKWEAHLGRHVPDEPLAGPLAMEVRYCYEPDRCHPEGTPKDTPPDTDNLDKVVRDAMGRLGYFAVGDQQIATGMSTKAYSRPEGVYVRIYEIGGMER